MYLVMMGQYYDSSSPPNTFPLRVLTLMLMNSVSCQILIYNYHIQLLSGGNHDIDVDDLRKNTRYTGGYSDGNRTIKIFWEVLTILWWLNELMFCIIRCS